VIVTIFWKKALLVTGGIVALVMAAGCVKLGSPVSLEERAQAYWSARCWQADGSESKGTTGEFRLYEEYVSAESKARMSERTFLKQQNLDVENAKVLFVEYDPDGVHATITVQYDTRMKSARIQGVKIKEDWVLENGKWMVIIPELRSPFRRKLL